MDRKSTNSDATTLRSHFSRFVRNRPRLKASLWSTLWRLTQAGFHGVVFGGALRDLMVHGPSTEPRDIDVVVDGVSVEELATIFKDVLVRRTRFGGLHLCVRGWMVDVWPLSQTWALKELRIGCRDFESLTRTTFLNVEAVTIDLAVRHGHRKVYSSGFFEAVRGRTLDINLEENPFPELAAVRALVTASKLRYAMTKRLARYIVDQAAVKPLEQLEDVQLSHYGHVKCDVETLNMWIKIIRAQMSTQSLISIPVMEPRQLLLWKESTSFMEQYVSPPILAHADVQDENRLHS